MTTVWFAVDSAFTGGDAIAARGDSAYVNPTGLVADPAGNVQRAPANRRVALEVQAVASAWALRVGPNPFTPGASLVERFTPQGAGLARDGVLFEAAPAVPLPSSGGLDGRVRIYDGVGTMIREGVMAISEGRLYWVWDGRNSAGRLVGSGSYVALVQAGHEKGRMGEWRRTVGVLRRRM